MAVSSEKPQRPNQKVEVLARACQHFEPLVEKLRKTTKLEKYDILYDMGRYQMVVDGQKTLDEAIKHNGNKLVVEFLLQKSEDETFSSVKMRKLTRVMDADSNSLFVSLPEADRVSNSGTLNGKSYGLPSNTSRISEKLHSIPARYTLGRKLGEGTLGTVYIAVGKKGGTYAVKIIQKNSRYLPQEADVEYLRELRHERIVNYLFIIEPTSSNDIHVLMEYMHLGSLKEYIENYGPLHHELVKAYTKQILEGLDFLHSKNIIHQDLKPANLLLKDNHCERLIKIADFGSSRFASLKKAKAGQQGRTPKYTDPGVSIGRDVAGRRSDIWSLGVIVIEMYTKVYPWKIDGEHPLTVPHIIEENPPIIATPTERTDEDLVVMAKMMLLPVAQRPYASQLLELSVFQEFSQNDGQDSDSEDDFF
ncbi:unnamed protein product [Caenorhabditis sp. 36 PRJEB53466]|nr:unnamed protein product [Caenorhabditis sp. 36 PRJEB53466]